MDGTIATDAARSAEDFIAPGSLLADRAASETFVRRCRMLLLALVLAGTIGRLSQYFTRTSFWSDETFIVVNIRDLTPAQLLGPLKFKQAAPPAFLWIEKACSHLWGINELSLRVLPLLCGIGGLALFAVLTWRVFPPAVAVCATGLFAFCDKFIVYSAEVKQYSGDVGMAVVLLFIAVGLRKRWPVAMRLMVASGFAAASIWLSHTSIFLFAASSLVLSLELIRERGVKGLCIAVACNLLVLASFSALFYFSIRHEHDPYLYSFWYAGFPSWDRGLWNLQWLVRQSYELGDWAYKFLGIITMPLAIVGAVSLARRRDFELLTTAALPILLVLAAACVHQYPYNGSRLTMFLFPGLFLLCGAGLDAARALAHERALSLRSGVVRYAWCILALPMLLWGGEQVVFRLFRPRFHSHIRPIVEYVRAHRKPDEAIYFLSPPAPAGATPDDEPTRHFEYQCYWPDVPQPMHETMDSPETVPEKRFWVVWPLHPDRKTRAVDPLLQQIRKVADEKDHKLVRQGGAAFLFERKAP